MSARRRLLPLTEVRSMLELLSEYGIDPKASVIDIRANGMTVSPPAAKPRNAYDEWKAKDDVRDRSGRK